MVWLALVYDPSSLEVKAGGSEVQSLRQGQVECLQLGPELKVQHHGQKMCIPWGCETCV